MGVALLWVGFPDLLKAVGGQRCEGVGNYTEDFICLFIKNVTGLVIQFLSHEKFIGRKLKI